MEYTVPTLSIVFMVIVALAGDSERCRTIYDTASFS